MVNYVPYIVRTQENSVLIMAGILTEIPVLFKHSKYIHKPAALFSEGNTNIPTKGMVLGR